MRRPSPPSRHWPIADTNGPQQNICRLRSLPRAQWRLSGLRFKAKIFRAASRVGPVPRHQRKRDRAREARPSGRLAQCRIRSKCVSRIGRSPRENTRPHASRRVSEAKKASGTGRRPPTFTARPALASVGHQIARSPSVDRQGPQAGEAEKRRYSRPWRIALLERFLQARPPPRYAAYLTPSSPIFLHSSTQYRPAPKAIGACLRTDWHSWINCAPVTGANCSDASGRARCHRIGQRVFYNNLASDWFLFNRRSHPRSISAALLVFCEGAPRML
jgi:hypothetical protein